MSARPRLARALAILTLAGFLGSCAGPRTVADAYLRDFADAEAAGKPFAPVTDARPDIALTDAYRLQARLVARRLASSDRVAGYKGGLMSAASLKSRGVGKPLVGVLFASGRTSSGQSVLLCGYRRAAFETKLGFVFRAAIREPTDAAALRGAVSAVVPVVELPDIAYRDPDRYGAADMVAANISSARFVRGAPHSPAGVDLDDLRVSMTRDGRPVTSGLGRESLGGQWESLAIVVEQILATGRTLSPGDLVLTGKIGDKGWLPPGAYAADYGPLGDVRFTVRPCHRP